MKERILNGLLILVVLLCLGITLNTHPPQSTPALSLDDTFASAAPSPTLRPLEKCQKERDAQREESIHSLTWLSQDPSAALQKEAQAALLSLHAATETETAAESMLCAMGYPDNVCILQKDGLLIFTQPSVKKEDALPILQSAADLSGLPPEKIHLMSP